MNISEQGKAISKRISLFSDSKKINTPIIIITVAAIIFVAFSGFTKEEKPGEKNVYNFNESDNSLNEYIEDLENRLKDAIKNIKGAGDVSVFITIENGEEKVLATDRKESVKKNNTSDAEGEKYIESESKVVIGGNNSNEKPYVIKEKKPVPAGVLVVAKGAENEKVRSEIYEAVKALFGLSAHRIKVCY